MTEQQPQVAIGPTAEGAGPASSSSEGTSGSPVGGGVRRPIWASLLQPGGADVPVVPYSPSAFTSSRREEAAAPAFAGPHADRILASLKGTVFSEPGPAQPATPPAQGARPPSAPLAARPGPAAPAAGGPSLAPTALAPAETRSTAGAPLGGNGLLEGLPTTTLPAMAANSGRPAPGPAAPGPALSLASPGARTAQEPEAAGAEVSAPDTAMEGPMGSEARCDDILPMPRKRTFSFGWR